MCFCLGGGGVKILKKLAHNLILSSVPLCQFPSSVVLRLLSSLSPAPDVEADS